MRAPEFWNRDGLLSRLLSPLSAIYAASVRRRLERVPFRAPVPVICVGNIVAGGAGKTPVALALAERLAGRGRKPHLLTRGHGGTEVGPRLVDPLRHDFSRVGDEALLLAAAAPTWVARDRAEGAAAAAAMGADCLVMDDGFQNPSPAKDLSLVVVDGGYGFGNRRVIPAGPCREPPARGLARAGAAVLVGADKAGIEPMLRGLPLLRARLVPGPEAAALAGRQVFAFAGIGRPEKFFATLEEAGARLARTRAFPDHHPYSEAEIERLLAEAEELGAVPVTTAKDHVRIPARLKEKVSVLTATLAWEDTKTLDRLLDEVLAP